MTESICCRHSSVKHRLDGCALSCNGLLQNPAREGIARAKNQLKTAAIQEKGDDASGCACSLCRCWRKPTCNLDSGGWLVYVALTDCIYKRAVSHACIQDSSSNLLPFSSAKYLVERLEAPELDLYIATRRKASKTEPPAIRVSSDIVQIALCTSLRQTTWAQSATPAMQVWVFNCVTRLTFRPRSTAPVWSKLKRTAFSKSSMFAVSKRLPRLGVAVAAAKRPPH